MQAIVETLFDTVYLFSVITIGILMSRKSKGNRQLTMFGIMAVLLGSGDVFHLVPCAVALCTTGLENFTCSWGQASGSPLALMGLIIIVLFYKSAKENNDRAFRWMWLTIVLSFAFYIPVVLWADVIPMIGMLMIPKTCAYVWTVLIGYKAMKKEIA